MIPGIAILYFGILLHHPRLVFSIYFTYCACITAKNYYFRLTHYHGVRSAKAMTRAFWRGVDVLDRRAGFMIEIYRPEQFDALPVEADFDPQILRTEEASAHLLLRRGQEIAVRCSLWWQGTPPQPQGGEGLCGTIGHFQAADEAAAGELLGAACDLLAQQGCGYVLAPMHGNTYRSYRYATAGSEAQPPFLMEPPAAAGRDRFLERSGFVAVNHYFSCREALSNRDLTEHQARLAAQGIVLRPLDPQQVEETLREIYRLSYICFRDNAYYTDIPEGAFVAQYLAYRELLVPDLIQLAYQGENCIGFLFCIPDYLEQDGDSPRTLLMKTVAVLPEFRRHGVAAALFDTVRRAAWRRGFRQAIGALIQEENNSQRLLPDSALLRRYTLYGRAL